MRKNRLNFKSITLYAEGSSVFAEREAVIGPQPGYSNRGAPFSLPLLKLGWGEEFGEGLKSLLEIQNMSPLRREASL